MTRHCADVPLRNCSLTHSPLGKLSAVVHDCLSPTDFAGLCVPLPTQQLRLACVICDLTRLKGGYLRDCGLEKDQVGPLDKLNSE